MKTRKSTPKYEIYSYISQAVIFTGISKTRANDMARGMGKNVIVRPVKRLFKTSEDAVATPSDDIPAIKASE